MVLWCLLNVPNIKILFEIIKWFHIISFFELYQMCVRFIQWYSPKDSYGYHIHRISCALLLLELFIQYFSNGNVFHSTKMKWMNHKFSILLAFYLLSWPTYAQEYQDTKIRLDEGLSYRIQMQGSVSDNRTPLWLNANHNGLSSLEKNNGYFRAAVERKLTTDSLHRHLVSMPVRSHKLDWHLTNGGMSSRYGGLP